MPVTIIIQCSSVPLELEDLNDQSSEVVEKEENASRDDLLQQCLAKITNFIKQRQI